MKEFVMVIDEGTTGTRALIFNKEFEIVSQSYTEFTQYTPAEDKVEHDAMEIYEKSMDMCRKAMDKANIDPSDILSIGITNQRATCAVWDKENGIPVANAIVWQDNRTADFCSELNNGSWGEKARKSTGWTVSPVYSSLMLRWYLKNIDGLKEDIDSGKMLFGTMDTWLLWKMTGGKNHKVGYSNASVMGSMDLESGQWNEEFLDYLDVPVGIFPEIVDDAGFFGETDERLFGVKIPIHSMIADQHAALFSQGCLEKGTAKCTNGTGTFLDVNIGSKCAVSDKGLNTVVAWKIGGDIKYAIEGYAAVTGSAVQWLRDGLKTIESSEETEAIAYSVEDSNGVYFVPALAGLSAPFHDPFARGTIIGITRGTKAEHIVRATLEAIAFRCKDIIDAVEQDSGVKIKALKIDGGASKNNFLAQQMADMMDAIVERPHNVEATSLGCAQMAGLAAGLWKMEDFNLAFDIERRFEPEIDDEKRDERYSEWKRAVERASGWKVQYAFK
jgi:glycerol kinase